MGLRFVVVDGMHGAVTPSTLARNLGTGDESSCYWELWVP